MFILCLDCKIIHFTDEKDTDHLRMFKIEIRESGAALKISTNNQCFEKIARFSYQACDGGWEPLNSTAAAWGLEVEWSNSDETYMLKVRHLLMGITLKNI